MLNFDNSDMVPHFIYCFGGSCFNFIDFKKFLLSRMEKYEMQPSILTGLSMLRLNLITKEKSIAAYEEKLKNDDDWEHYEGSINDNLESFFHRLQEISSLEDINKEYVYNFFLPKLTKEELKLVEEQKKKYMSTFSANRLGYADVSEVMK